MVAVFDVFSFLVLNTLFDVTPSCSTAPSRESLRYRYCRIVKLKRSKHVWPKLRKRPFPYIEERFLAVLLRTLRSWMFWDFSRHSATDFQQKFGKQWFWGFSRRFVTHFIAKIRNWWSQWWGLKEVWTRKFFWNEFFGGCPIEDCFVTANKKIYMTVLSWSIQL